VIKIGLEGSLIIADPIIIHSRISLHSVKRREVDGYLLDLHVSLLLLYDLIG